jgi:hypothetical protein
VFLQRDLLPFPRRFTIERKILSSVPSHPQILKLILVIFSLPAVSRCIVADQELSLQKSEEAALPPTSSIL